MRKSIGSSFTPGSAGAFGWAGAAGNFTPGLATLPVGGAAMLAVDMTKYAQAFNNLLTELPPQELTKRARAKMEAMGIDEGLAEKFIDDKIFSPRHKLVITDSLASLGDAKGRGEFLAFSLIAQNEVEALFFQQVTETFAGYHRSVSPITSIEMLGVLPVGRAKNGTAVVAFAADRARWTHLSAPLLDKLVKAYGSDGRTKKIEIWLTGTASKRLKPELEVRNIVLVEDADKKIGMMD